MSIAVAIDRLGEEMARFGDSAFVLTTSDDGRPHISHVAVTHEDGLLRCTVGGRSAGNARTRAQIAVLWPPSSTDGFSLIVDADATVDGSELRLTPTKAVLHRPAPVQ
ncbi:MAG TPA: hypothetical protein VM282_04505 [Acidimicrobiales bacterium]|nr:hypothetical protein [Acidimicrobiales bacterium]